MGHTSYALENSEGKGTCSPQKPAFKGYSFILPSNVNTRNAYAPFLLHYRGAYESYYNYDIQKAENLKEWNERFCNLCSEKDIEAVVYRSLNSQLSSLQQAAANRNQRMSYALAGNSFADAIVNMGCTEVLEYLYYAKKCEPFATRDANWERFRADTLGAKKLIQEGLIKFKQIESHYVRMRFAYQIIRLAHYTGLYEDTLLLYQRLMNQIDWRKESILFYWIMGHQAGALQKLGRYPEAAYRYALVFQNCPSKRIQAFRSFYLRHQKDWEDALLLCKNNRERATLHILRVGADPRKRHEDLRAIYKLNPKNELLDVLLIGELQEVEEVLLRNKYTALRYGTEPSQKRIKSAHKHAQEMRVFIQNIVKEDRLLHPKLWTACDGYLAVLLDEPMWANHIFSKLKTKLSSRDSYESKLLNQVEIWDNVARLKFTPLDSKEAENIIHAVGKMDEMNKIPNFSSFYKDFVAASFEREGHTGKATTVAFDAEELKFNPKMDALKDMIEATLRNDQSSMENAITTDSVQLTIADDLLQLEAALLLDEGEFEAAYLVLRRLSPYLRAADEKFTPFKETIKDCIHCPYKDSINVSRRFVVKRMMEYDRSAKAAEALDQAVAGYYHYLNGLAFYNTSYFGHAWKVRDRFRSGGTWTQLSKGPVFKHPSTNTGNKENVDLSLALEEFREAIRLSRNPELAARAAFMAARCEQKMWFCSPTCNYTYGTNSIPEFALSHLTYTEYFLKNFKGTHFYNKAVLECSWMGAYSRRYSY